jgi:hypothetical protein
VVWCGVLGGLVWCVGWFGVVFWVVWCGVLGGVVCWVMWFGVMFWCPVFVCFLVGLDEIFCSFYCC